MTADIRKYDFIDALRGFAILGVVMVHSSQHVAPLNETLQLIMDRGTRGVQLFYIASALTLCLSWFFRGQHETHPARNFFIRRFFRIAPMFYIAIAFYVALYGLAPNWFAPNGIKWWFVLLTGLFLHGFHPETISSVVPGGWSVAVEMNFYVVLPFLLSRIKNINASLVFIVISLAICELTKIACQHFLLPLYPGDQQYLVSSVFMSLNFFNQLPVFAFGLLAYFIFRDAGSLKRWVLIGNGVFVALMLLVKSGLVTQHGIVYVFSKHYLIEAVFVLFALTLACYPLKLLVNPVTRFLGKVSFSMYLTHFAVLELFARTGFSAKFPQGDLSSVLHYFCVVTVAALISYVLYLTVEKHGILYGKRLIDWLEVQPKQ